MVYHQSGKIRQEAVWHIEINRQGIKDNALTIGQRGRRALQIYDKILEVEKKGGKHWYDIWDLEPDKLKDIWRIEVRFFKSYIRNAHLRTFYDLERNLAGAIEKTFSSVRYVTPTKDSNRSRWQNVEFWDEAQKSACQALEYEGCDLLPETVNAMRRETSLKAIEGMFPGLLLSYTALRGMKFTECMDALKHLEGNLKALMQDAPEKLRKKYEDSKKRYSLPDLSD